MYLTRMYLNPRRRQSTRFKRDPEVAHAAVESAFPPSADRSRTLWRLDGGGDELKLLILSRSIPSLEHVQEQAGWEGQVTWESRPYEQLLARVTAGQRYGFRLTANPVHTVTSSTGKKRRVAHVSVAQQLSWLSQRAEQSGVRFLDVNGSPHDAAAETSIEVQVSNRETLTFRRGEHLVTLARVQYDGALEVDNAELLRTALVNGIGRAKAYGCGLLTLAPLQTDG